MEYPLIYYTGIPDGVKSNSLALAFSQLRNEREMGHLDCRPAKLKYYDEY